MLREKTFRYALLVLLPTAIGFLYLYYQNIRNEKASVILLASYHPYNDDDLKETEHRFRSFANSYHDGFFQDSTLYNNLIDKFSALQESLDSAELPLARLDERLWTSELSPFQFYQRDISIADNTAAALFRANREYVEAFQLVLKQTHWMSHRRYDDFHLTMAIDLDVKPSEAALKEFEKMFTAKSLIEINKKTFDLNRITLFDLFVVLEQIKWQRFRVEEKYLEAISIQEKKQQELRSKSIETHSQKMIVKLHYTIITLLAAVAVFLGVTISRMNQIPDRDVLDLHLRVVDEAIRKTDSICQRRYTMLKKDWGKSQNLQIIGAIKLADQLMNFEDSANSIFI